MGHLDVDRFTQVLRDMLETLRGKSRDALDVISREVASFADVTDRATAESDRAFTLRLRDRERRLIKKIKEAIERIDDGTYGECVECGEDISVARMKARPVTTLCIKCKSRQEADEDLRGD